MAASDAVGDEAADEEVGKSAFRAVSVWLAARLP